VKPEERGDGRARLAGQVAVVVGAGQTPGDTIGNGRATALLFAGHGARVLAVDRLADRAAATAGEIRANGGDAEPFAADVTREADCRALVAAARERFGRLDVLHYNVGIGGGDADALRLEESEWQRILDVNLKGAYLAAKHALPVMREQGSGCLIFISSIAAVCAVPTLAYKTSKAGLNALAHSIATSNARHGVRCNVIMPGLMDTPMAIEGISKARGVEKGELRRMRDAAVPLGAKMGTAWDVAYAALFLASDEARFITGVELPVDGGQRAKIG
jgi:NAD(P)-dependent dehydrogenase (short-subunit alcohol dehydrogenase family)